jgi:chaperonin GroES
MLKPLGDRVVVEAIQKDPTTPSGIVLPETSKEKPQEGTVIAVGNGAVHNGERLPLEVQVGDRILFSAYSGTEVKQDGRELLVMRESDILAVMK